MKAQGALTTLAIKVYVEVREFVCVFLATPTVFFAKRKLGLPAAVLHLMHDMLFQKEI